MAGAKRSGLLANGKLESTVTDTWVSGPPTHWAWQSNSTCEVDRLSARFAECGQLYWRVASCKVAVADKAPFPLGRNLLQKRRSVHSGYQDKNPQVVQPTYTA